MCIGAVQYTSPGTVCSLVCCQMMTNVLVLLMAVPVIWSAETTSAHSLADALLGMTLALLEVNALVSL